MPSEQTAELSARNEGGGNGIGADVLVQNGNILSLPQPRKLVLKTYNKLTLMTWIQIYVIFNNRHSEKRRQGAVGSRYQRFFDYPAIGRKITAPTATQGFCSLRCAKCIQPAIWYGR